MSAPILCEESKNKRIILYIALIKLGQQASMEIYEFKRLRSFSTFSQEHFVLKQFKYYIKKYVCASITRRNIAKTHYLYK